MRMKVFFTVTIGLHTCDSAVKRIYEFDGHVGNKNENI